MIDIDTDSTYNLSFGNSVVSIEKNSFYTDKKIQIFEEKNILNIDKDSIPLLKGITIKLNANRYNDSLIDKSYIARIQENKKSSFVSNKKENNRIVAKINNLGNYTVKVDSIAPEISLINMSENQWISNRTKLMIKINDNGSGVDTYRGTINDKWILLEYNPMKGILTYDFNDNINKTNSKNILEVEIKDNVGNIKKLKTAFYRQIKE